MDIVLLQPSIINDNIQARRLWAGLSGSVIHSVRRSEESSGGNKQEKQKEWRRFGKKEEEENRLWREASMAQRRVEIVGFSETKLLFMGNFSLDPSPFPHSAHPFLWLSCFLCQSIFYNCRFRAMNPHPHPHSPLPEWQMRVRMSVEAKWKAVGVGQGRAEWWRNMKWQETAKAKRESVQQVSTEPHWQMYECDTG